MNKQLSAIVTGATGEVGKAIAIELGKAPEFTRVRLITRRAVELPLEADGKFDQKIIEDFEKLSEHKDVFEGFDISFCALGTTRGKAGTEGFIKVDHDYIVDIAKLSKEGGSKQFHLISSRGANKNSHFLYLKTKGETEEDIKAMGFPYLAIYRPALLLTPREEPRAVERFFQMLARPLDYWRWASIETTTLANVAVQNSLNKFGELSNTQIFENSQIVNMGKQLECPQNLE